jgi:hypothetical protein
MKIPQTLGRKMELLKRIGTDVAARSCETNLEKTRSIRRQSTTLSRYFPGSMDIHGKK